MRLNIPNNYLDDFCHNDHKIKVSICGESKEDVALYSTIEGAMQDVKFWTKRLIKVPVEKSHKCKIVIQYI